jgi:hypothetical protein
MPACVSPDRECGLTSPGERAAFDDQFAPGDEDGQDDSTNGQRGHIVDSTALACRSSTAVPQQ